MRKITILLIFSLVVPFLCSCQQQTPEPEINVTELRQDIQELTEELFRIHLQLDTAISEISEAETAARDENFSGAEFHAAEAYRSLVQADEDLLDLGRDLQASVGLDIQDANR
jgi:hypothetical protein